MEVGELISIYRRQAGMTIDELVEKSGVAKGTLNKIIGGVTKAPTLDNMKSIARALGKRLSDFDDEPQPADYFSAFEQAHIKKYRLLDPYGKEAVDGVLDVESRRCEADRQAKAPALRESREQMEAAEEAPAPSEMPTPFYEGGLEVSADELMKYVSRLNPGQQKMILEQAEKMIAAQKELAVSSVPPKGGNTPPESDSPTQS